MLRVAGRPPQQGGWGRKLTGRPRTARPQALADDVRKGDRKQIEQKYKFEEAKRQGFEGKRKKELKKLKEKRTVNDAKFKSKAAQIKADAMAVRARAKAEKDALMKEKAAHAKHERSNDHLVELVSACRTWRAEGEGGRERRGRVGCAAAGAEGTGGQDRGREAVRCGEFCAGIAWGCVGHPRRAARGALSSPPFATAQEKKKVMQEKRLKAQAVFRERYANAQAAEFVAQQVQSTSFYLLERGAGLPDPGMPNAR